jgi:hypothetical protein
MGLSAENIRSLIKDINKFKLPLKKEKWRLGQFFMIRLRRELTNEEYFDLNLIMMLILIRIKEKQFNLLK